MSDMKCPICQNNLHKINIVVSTCTNDKCKLWGSPIPNLVLEALAQKEQDLECICKALDVAKYAIKNIKDDMKKVKDGDDIWEIQKNLHDYCKTTLEQITALEQKDAKCK